MSTGTAKIVMCRHGHGEIFINGQPQKHVLAFSFDAAVGCRNTLTVTYAVDEIEIVSDETDIASEQ